MTLDVGYVPLIYLVIGVGVCILIGGWLGHYLWRKHVETQGYKSVADRVHAERESRRRHPTGGSE